MRRRETWALQQKANCWYLVWNVPKAIRGLPMFGGRRLYTMNRPYFPRHLKSLKLRSFRRCYEQAATLHGRIQTGRRQAGD